MENENFLPGLKPVLELLRSSPADIDQIYLRKGRPSRESSELLDLCRSAKVRFTLLPDDALTRLCPGAHHQGVLARLRVSSRTEWETLLSEAVNAPLPLIVALDQVQDPGNVGTLARTLYALGGAGLVLPRHNSAYLGPGARRSAAGALERLPLAEVVNLSRAVEQAEKAGFVTYAARFADDGQNALSSRLELPALLVLGNEDKGVRPGVAKRCTHSLYIPFLREFDSLNVAQAGGILISCFARTHLGASVFTSS